MAPRNRIHRPKLDELDLSLGKRTRLHRILYEHGPGNGLALLLPVDQGIEHGPRDFFDNPESLDPRYELELARKGGYSGIVFQVGLAEKYMKDYAGEIPLILKINGKTSIPSDKYALSPLTASVEDAVRLGADAVGYTLYVGSPAQDQDILQLSQVRKDADRLGMPLIIWAYPRGEAIDAQGGKDTLYAIDYAARMACELGADLVKVNFPELDSPKNELTPEPYRSLSFTSEEAVRKIVQSAGKTMVLISGGGRVDDETILARVKICLAAGVTGFIFGRNMWQRTREEALSLTEKIKKMLRKETEKASG